MGTETTCPVCRELIEVPEDAPGRKIGCPHCSTRFQVEENGILVRLGAPTEVTTDPKKSPARGVRDRDDEEAEVPRRRRRRRWDEEKAEEDYPRRRRLSFRKLGMTRQAALDKVRAPGTILQFYGVFLLLAGIGCFLGVPFAAQADEDAEVTVIVLGVCGILCLACGIITVLGGTRFKQLRSYGLVLATIIITFVVAFLACTPLVVVGIWPLVVFMDATVKENFDRPPEEIEEDER